MKIASLGVKGQVGKSAYSYGQVGVGREAICLSYFPLLLQLAFVFPGIVVGTQVFFLLFFYACITKVKLHYYVWVKYGVQEKIYTRLIPTPA
jgi:hypothetical protein